MDLLIWTARGKAIISSVFNLFHPSLCWKDAFDSSLSTMHRRRQEFYYVDFGWGTLIHFPASIDKFLIFPIHFFNFGEVTFPIFPHPGGAYAMVICLKVRDDSKADNLFITLLVVKPICLKLVTTARVPSRLDKVHRFFL